MSAQWHDMREVGLEFLDSAPRVYVMQAELDAPRARVWDAFADASTWEHWFPGVETADYPGETRPYGVGCFRASTVSGQKYEEYMLAWDEPARWAYYIARATLPIARAQLECTDFEDAGSGTRVRWTLATDPLQDLDFMADGKPFQDFLQGLHEEAMRNLEAYLKSKL